MTGLYFRFADFCNTEMLRQSNTTGNLRMAGMCELPTGRSEDRRVGSRSVTHHFFILGSRRGGLRLRLILLRHERRRPFDTGMTPQQGHRGKVLMSARIRRKRMVAIEFGMCRSGREGGSSGSIIVG